MSERITVDLKVEVTVEDIERLRVAAAFNYQQNGEGEVVMLLPEGNLQKLAAQFLGAKLWDAMAEFPDVFSDLSVEGR